MVEEIGRLAKFLSRAGVCSRRDGEKLITEGRVKVNGKIILSPALNVSDQDQIMVDDKLVRDIPQSKVWCYYKPVGQVTTHKDEHGRPTVFDHVKKLGLPRVISVGRLDLNSEGLLLLTNDGGFARMAELPSTGWDRVYRVRVYGVLNIDKLMSLKNGITIEGVRYESINVEIENDESSSRNQWLQMTLSEGKNREIRKVMNHLELQVNRLIRLSYGPYHLGNLKPGQVRVEKILGHKKADA